MGETKKRELGALMRKLGPEPLTGAEKQRRHRAKVKARLAEAEELKARLDGGLGSNFIGLRAFYESILAELGAAPEEREALIGDLEALSGELREFARQRGEKALAALRARRRKGDGGLLSRLAALKPDKAEG